jgi:AmmeMemoRadiSam system protein B
LPAVAGAFYPANARALKTMIDELLATVEAYEIGAPPKAIIAPHAGYVYSGPIAASAYARIRSARDQISRVVLLGPAHRVPLHGLALPASTAFATPLGDVAVDQEAVHAVSGLPQVRVFNEAHALEHSLEVHLPFLQRVLGEFQILPLVVGDASADEVAEALERVWGGPETLIVISSDLSHYHDYKTATQMDGATSDAIERLAYEELQFDQACGRVPVSGLLLAARRRGMKGKTIDLRNSGDTAGPRDQVVGYGAYVFRQ